jgi:hypothetical protein
MAEEQAGTPVSYDDGLANVRAENDLLIATLRARTAEVGQRTAMEELAGMISGLSPDALRGRYIAALLQLAG